MRKAILLLCLAVLLCGCAKGEQVYVQSVETLSGLGGIGPGDKFLGLVVSENVSQIQRDKEKTIQELLVVEGQDVKEGQPLFSYDTQQLQLTLEKQKLELEQLTTSIESYQKQIAQLEKERETLGPNGKLQYTIQIQTTQVDLKEAELNLKTKENEVKKSEELLANTTVLSPVAGRVQAINENGTDNEGKELPYITIQQVGAYRVKGMLNELQRGSLREGDRVTLCPRTAPETTWGGTVTLVDYENPTQGGSNSQYFGNTPDEMTASSRYPFYVQLDTTDGLILGQHMYLELERDGAETPALQLSGSFLCWNEDGSPYVWAENRGKLEKRPVTLGQYNDMRDTYEVVAGLTKDDYLAFPDALLCKEGASTTREQPVSETEPPVVSPEEVS